MSETTSTGYSIQFRDANGTPLYPIVRASGVIMPNNEYLNLTDYAKRAELISVISLVVSALPSADTADHRLIYCVPSGSGDGYTNFVPVNKGTALAPEWEWVSLKGATINVDPDNEELEALFDYVDEKLSYKAPSESVYTKAETYSKAEVEAVVALDVTYVSLGETEIEASRLSPDSPGNNDTGNNDTGDGENNKTTEEGE
jgi:hypothetical protein